MLFFVIKKAYEYLIVTEGLYIGCPRKNKPLFIRNFLGDNETEFIEILLTVTLGYYQHFYKVSKRSVANYMSIVKFKTTSQKMQYQSKIYLFQSMLNVTSMLLHD